MYMALVAFRLVDERHHDGDDNDSDDENDNQSDGDLELEVSPPHFSLERSGTLLKLKRSVSHIVRLILENIKIVHVTNQVLDILLHNALDLLYL